MCTRSRPAPFCGESGLLPIQHARRFEHAMILASCCAQGPPCCSSGVQSLSFQALPARSELAGPVSTLELGKRPWAAALHAWAAGIARSRSMGRTEVIVICWPPYTALPAPCRCERCTSAPRSARAGASAPGGCAGKAAALFCGTAVHAHPCGGGAAVTRAFAADPAKGAGDSLCAHTHGHRAADPSTHAVEQAQAGAGRSS